MRKTLLFVLPLLLIVGCSKEPINFETSLVERDGVYYTKDTNKPYSGRVFSLFDDGKKESEGTFKDGKPDGVATRWYENGQKEWEGTIKDGKEDGLHTEWHENGQKYKEGTYKDGKRDGLVSEWYVTGQKSDEGNYKDGEKDGLWTGWYRNGQKKEEVNFKDGEMFSPMCWDEDGYEKDCNYIFYPNHSSKRSLK